MKRKRITEEDLKPRRTFKRPNGEHRTITQCLFHRSAQTQRLVVFTDGTRAAGRTSTGAKKPLRKRSVNVKAFLLWVNRGRAVASR